MERHHACEKKCIKKCVPGRAPSIKWLIISTHIYKVKVLFSGTWSFKTSMPSSALHRPLWPVWSLWQLFLFIENGFRWSAVALRPKKSRASCSELMLFVFKWQMGITRRCNNSYSVQPHDQMTEMESGLFLSVDMGC